LVSNSFNSLFLGETKIKKRKSLFAFQNLSSCNKQVQRYI
jgi:hypothetical protein